METRKIYAILLMFIIPALAYGNLVNNPSMEGNFIYQNPLGDVAEYWTGWRSGGNLHASFNEYNGSWGSHDGSKSQELSWVGYDYQAFGPDGIYQQISSLEPGQSYLVSVWFKTAFWVDSYYGWEGTSSYQITCSVGIDPNGGTDPNEVTKWSSWTSSLHQGADENWVTSWVEVSMPFRPNIETATIFIKVDGFGNVEEALPDPSSDWGSQCYVDDVVVQVKEPVIVNFWDITTVDSTGKVGIGSSIEILPSGQPAISYFDYTNKDLKYAWYDGSVWHKAIVDSGLGYYASQTSLAMLPSGQPAISYRDYTNKDLKYAWYDGSVWHTEVVDSTAEVGSSISMAVLLSGQPAISYYEDANNDLKYAWYDGSAWQTTTVDSEGALGNSTSLAILPSGYPAISYHDNTNGDLKYAWHDGSAWQNIVVDSAGTVGFNNSLAILPSGQPAISYYDGTNYDLKYAWYDGSTWQNIVVDSAGTVGSNTSLAILPTGQPAIAYCGKHADHSYHCQKYAWYDGSAWNIALVDKGWSKDATTWARIEYSYSSLAILPSGRPAISYYSGGGSGSSQPFWDLKFATLVNTPHAPVTMIPSYTATAHTDLGGTAVTINAPAYNYGEKWAEYPEGEETWAESSVEFETTTRGQLRGWIVLIGNDGKECFGLDPETGECWWDGPVSCGDANGAVSGTVFLGTSESCPGGTELDIDLQVLIGGNPADFEDYYLKVWRGPSLVAQIDPCAPASISVSVFAGETLTFELFASEEDWYGDWEEYDRFFEFRFILRGPTNFDGIGTVDFRDYAIFALHWLDTGCNDPTWCGKTDLDKSGDVNWPDLKIFTDHWLE